MHADALFRLEQVTLWPMRLRNISLAIQHGITAVLGPSGAGKTSLLNLLAGFEKPNLGKLHGDTLVAWTPHGDGLWPGCTAREHLAECGTDSATADALLASFDLAHLGNAKPQKLSRGEQSRLALARALAMSPRTLVMDEPLAHLDRARAGKYWRAIREHIARTGASLIFATHTPELALSEAANAICLRDGGVAFSGEVAELYERPASEELAGFLGPANWLTPGDARVWIGPEWSAARCVRPERLMISPADNGNATVVSSRFFGAYAETELRAADGSVRMFIHRPAQAFARETRVRITFAPPPPQ